MQGVVLGSYIYSNVAISTEWVDLGIFYLEQSKWLNQKIAQRETGQMGGCSQVTQSVFLIDKTS